FSFCLSSASTTIRSSARFDSLKSLMLRFSLSVVRCLWSCSLVAFSVTYAETVSDRELALPGHAQLRRRSVNSRASCARRHPARFRQRQNLPQRRRLPLLSHDCVRPPHSTASQFRRSKFALLRAQKICRHLATRRRFHPRTR